MSSGIMNMVLLAMVSQYLWEKNEVPELFNLREAVAEALGLDEH